MLSAAAFDPTPRSLTKEAALQLIPAEGELHTFLGPACLSGCDMTVQRIREEINAARALEISDHGMAVVMDHRLRITCASGATLWIETPTVELTSQKQRRHKAKGFTSRASAAR